MKRENERVRSSPALLLQPFCESDAPQHQARNKARSVLGVAAWRRSPPLQQDHVY